MSVERAFGVSERSIVGVDGGPEEDVEVRIVHVGAFDSAPRIPAFFPSRNAKYPKPELSKGAPTLAVTVAVVALEFARNSRPQYSLSVGRLATVVGRKSRCQS